MTRRALDLAHLVGKVVIIETQKDGVDDGLPTYHIGRLVALHQRPFSARTIGGVRIDWRQNDVVAILDGGAGGPYPTTSVIIQPHTTITDRDAASEEGLY
jgi:hypothetical protein